MKKRVSSHGVEEFTDSKVGFAIVEADSHDEAVRMFAEHPHLGLHGGNSIEVLECPSLPGG
jgi:hypothetical protein